MNCLYFFNIKNLLQVFFALRSEYFKALLTDHFCEAEHSSDGIPRITIRGVHPQVFAAIVHYVYTNQVITEVSRGSQMTLYFFKPKQT